LNRKDCLCRTSKMSHDHSRHDSCEIRISSREFHFRNGFDSTRRDGCGRWLWRLVRRTQRWKTAESKSVLFSWRNATLKLLAREAGIENRPTAKPAEPAFESLGLPTADARPFEAEPHSFLVAAHDRRRVAKK
jgi:hypothetical protein